MVSVLTDCPHREKLGWLEQFHLNGPSIRYEFDTSRASSPRRMHDMADAQTDDGLVPNIAPEYTVFEGAFRHAAEWGAAFILVPWQQYLFDGDVELLRDALRRDEAVRRLPRVADARRHPVGRPRRLVRPRPRQARAGRASRPPPITATAYYYLDAATLAQIARVLGKADDAARFDGQGRRRFGIATTAEFFDPAPRTYAHRLTGVAGDPAGDGPGRAAGPTRRVLEALVRDVEQRGYATAGDVGFRSLLQALASDGRSDVVYRLINQDEKPGYGYQLRKGATALTEAWDANLGSSHNHFMLGQVIEWFYQDLAGITADPAGPGFKAIVLRPQPVADLAWAEASYESLRGPIYDPLGAPRRALHADGDDPGQHDGDRPRALARRQRGHGRRRSRGVTAGRHVRAPRGGPGRLPHRVGRYVFESRW